MSQPIVAATLAGLGAELRRAREAAVAIRPLSERFPQLSVPEAYQIQDAFIAGSVADGARRVGRKIGFSSEAMQLQFGIDRLDRGVLLDRDILESGSVVDPRRLIAPRVEAEIAVVLQRDLRGPGVTLDDVAHAVGYGVAAIEIIDSRIANWDVELVDTIADNASSGFAVINDVPSTLAPHQLIGENVRLLCDGQEIARGKGDALQGDPLRALQWLANELGHEGRHLGAGELVLVGAVHASVALEAGRRYRAIYRSGLVVEFEAQLADGQATTGGVRQLN